ncbi:hypothetical protein JSO19_03710 [Leucobacter sp. UCMA 4100]|uniref:hypothetical protein n=1 Tax=Leucobacter sp. UCMA 4100 TaxID=2810534 RepID=UPI0022EA401B|nr:hypothetical protein [Leucobacter sp. UCMA 4100]MDA3146482.1 hypothetical protein [Leucobacter sp. UCMA 4100]
MNGASQYTSSEKRSAITYVWEMTSGLLLFILLFIALPALWHTEHGTWQHLTRTLLPLVPLVWVPFAIWRHGRRMDEMQRQFFSRSMSFGFAAAMVAAVTIGLLEGGGFSIPMSGMVIFTVGMAAWGIALPVSFARGNR